MSIEAFFAIVAAIACVAMILVASRLAYEFLAGRQEQRAAIRALDRALRRWPNLRICQLIVNATTSDPYYVTDSDLAAALDRYSAQEGPW